MPGFVNILIGDEVIQAAEARARFRIREAQFIHADDGHWRGSWGQVGYRGKNVAGQYSHQRQAAG